jgi:predicted peptidase
MRFSLLAAALLGLGGCAGSPVTTPEADRTEVVPRLVGADSAAAAHAVAEIEALSPDLFEAGTFADDSATIRYRLMPPPRVEPGDRSPLVVVFHGAGEIGTDALSHMDRFPKSWARPEVRQRFPAFVLAPQMPARSAIYSGPAETPGRFSRPGPPLHTALALIDSLRRALPVDPARIYAVGFSMGASTTWNALVLRPDLFAAAVPLAGVPPAPTEAGRIARTPLWVVHGTNDTANPIGPDRAMVGRLRREPGADVRFWAVDGLGHAVPPRLLAGTEVMEWLFAHRR